MKASKTYLRFHSLGVDSGFRASALRGDSFGEFAESGLVIGRDFPGELQPEVLWLVLWIIGGTASTAWDLIVRASAWRRQK